MFAVIIYTPLCLGLPAFYNQKWEGNGKQAVWICCYIFLNLIFLFFLLLNHKNTLIYLWSIVHILASLKKKLQPVILLWNVFSVGMSVFVLVCVTPPTSSLPNSIQHPGLPVVGKHSVLQPWRPLIADSTWRKRPQHPSKKLCDQRNIEMLINQLINLQCKAHHQSGNPCEHRVWGGGVGETALSSILNLDCRTHFNL